jgi:hypothetical protein
VVVAVQRVVLLETLMVQKMVDLEEVVEKLTPVVVLELVVKEMLEDHMPHNHTILEVAAVVPVLLVVLQRDQQQVLEELVLLLVG